jgi:hypothetical protein
VVPGLCEGRAMKPTQDNTRSGEVDVYPVGLLADFRRWRSARRNEPPEHARWVRRQAVGYLVRRLRERRFRAVRMAFNGYLAEPRDWPEGLRRCGSGWTQRRARRDLERRVRRLP